MPDRLTMLDLRRFYGIVLIAIGLAIALTSLQVLLERSRPWWPAPLQHDIGIWPFDGYKVAGGQLSSIVREKLPRDEPIGIVIGTSTVYHGIDTALLESTTSPRTHWRRLTVFGSTTRELIPIVNQIYHSNLKPATLVLALEAKMLAISPTYRHAAFDARTEVRPATLLDDAVQLRVNALVAGIEGLVSNVFNQWFFDRGRIYGRLVIPRALIRMNTLEALGQHAAQIFSPNWRQWTPHLEHEFVNLTDEELLTLQTMASAKGAFDQSLYSPTSDTSQALVQIVRQARSAGTTVVIVIMPERRAFQKLYPPSALRTLNELLANEFGANAPPVISLRDSVPDDGFFDYYHMTAAGKKLFSQRLAQELQKLQPSVTLH